MPIGTLAPGTDRFDLQVDFGGYTYAMFFGPDARHPLPAEPPPAGGRCLCPGCTSESWYAISPACRYWRAHCHCCAGVRFYRDFSAGRPARRTRCELCAVAWRDDVNWFRAALRDPRGCARRLRQEAAAAKRTAQQEHQLSDMCQRGSEQHYGTDQYTRRSAAPELREPGSASTSDSIPTACGVLR